MAVVKVPQSAANAVDGSLVYELTVIVNALAAAVNELKADYNATLAKLDLDAGVTDVNYASLNSAGFADADTISFNETGTPS